ncbi:MAG: Asp-tRNA(Asn)/Glu-tRNA(Gln) amidotransferase subunit GatC [Candidatus Aenigmarchaeota archaeon]|nr:Asp-tRNA(Asn)/Glu-tRNA(Gln) amidotransferase subunit GatC [Candidatus Aenigmarchaeota archaeon]
MAFKDIDKLCKLSRIDLTDKEKKEFSGQIGEVISMFDELDSINTDKVKPAFHIYDIKNKYRDDKICKFEDRKALEENIEFSKDGHVIGPKVFE